MDSTQLEKYSFIKWYPFTRTAINDAPRTFGTYVMRMKNGKLFGRLRGCSDIVYIGHSERPKNGIYGRLLDYFRKPGRTQLTNQRIIKLATKYEFEISWVSIMKARDLEMRLLMIYEDDHDELPPINRQSVIYVRDSQDLPMSLDVHHPVT